MSVTDVARTQSVDVRIARSPDEYQRILAIRAVVFRDEQNMVEANVSDSDDESSVHAYALIDGEAVAAGRLTPPGGGRSEAQIAWVATLPEHRGRGAGAAVLGRLLEIADQYRFPSVLISAQTHALDFYREFGFRPYGNRFRVRGIEHQYMERRAPA